MSHNYVTGPPPRPTQPAVPSELPTNHKEAQFLLRLWQDYGKKLSETKKSVSEEEAYCKDVVAMLKVTAEDLSQPLPSSKKRKRPLPSEFHDNAAVPPTKKQKVSDRKTAKQRSRTVSPDKKARKSSKTKHRSQSPVEKKRKSAKDSPKKKRKKKDPNAPKKAPTAWTLFVQRHMKVDNGTFQTASEQWKALSAEEKRPWQEKAEIAREEREAEIKAFKERKAAAVDSDGDVIVLDAKKSPRQKTATSKSRKSSKTSTKSSEKKKKRKKEKKKKRKRTSYSSSEESEDSSESEESESETPEPRKRKKHKSKHKDKDKERSKKKKRKKKTELGKTEKKKGLITGKAEIPKSAKKAPPKSKVSITISSDEDASSLNVTESQAMNDVNAALTEDQPILPSQSDASEPEFDL